jgi:hypothetical protein
MILQREPKIGKTRYDPFAGFIVSEVT